MKNVAKKFAYEKDVQLEQENAKEALDLLNREREDERKEKYNGRD